MIDWNSREWLNYLDEKVWENLPASSLKSRNNSEITFRCPICGDSKKNRLKKRGYYYRRTGTYHCFNCEANLTGFALLKVLCPNDVFDRIIQDFKVLNFNSIVKSGCSDTSTLVEAPRGFDILSPNPSYKYLLDAGWRVEALSSEATAYLNGRKIPVDRRDMLKSIKDKDGREFILIQYIWDDIPMYHQLANFNKYDISGQDAVKYIFPKDENINFQQKPVFNLVGVDVSFPYIFATEGIFDSLFLKNGVALGGRSLTDYQREMLKSCYPRHKLVIALDNDKAGTQSMLKLAKKDPDLLFLDIGDILNISNSKDINDFVKATGRADVFTNIKLLKRKTVSAFQMEMKLKLHG